MCARLARDVRHDEPRPAVRHVMVQCARDRSRRRCRHRASSFIAYPSAASRRTSKRRSTAACARARRLSSASACKRRRVVVEELADADPRARAASAAARSGRSRTAARSRRAAAVRRATRALISVFSSPRARPRQRQRLERLQQPAHFRARPLGAARDHRHAPDSRRERLDDQARFAIRDTRAARMPARRRAAVAVGACHVLHCRSVAEARERRVAVGPAALHAHEDLEEHLAAEERSMSWRASVAMPSCARRPSPSRIARWLALST